MAAVFGCFGCCQGHLQPLIRKQDRCNYLQLYLRASCILHLQRLFRLRLGSSSHHECHNLFSSLKRRLRPPSFELASTHPLGPQGKMPAAITDGPAVAMSCQCIASPRLEHSLLTVVSMQLPTISGAKTMLASAPFWSE